MRVRVDCIVGIEAKDGEDAVIRIFDILKASGVELEIDELRASEIGKDM